jgi:hypothetical protein
MPNEDRDENCYKDDDDDADRGSAAAVAAFLNYYRALSHAGSCSSILPAILHEAPVIPTRSKHVCVRRKKTRFMVWDTVGLILSLLTGGAAIWRARRVSTNYYEAGVYAMTPALHRRYAVISFVFAGLFALAYFKAFVPVVPLLAAAVLVSIFYFTSFLRGFSEEE